ncbi:MAG TPA: SRPBCC family protein [Chthoniobacteraceae bacterium]|nr:SRPBCC family protein [Chthoniobacteraceae bacterium]
MKSIRIRLGLLALTVGVAPLFLPRRPRIARRVLIRADAAHIFPLINDLRNWPRWTAWNQRQEIEYHYDGPAAGAGATQHWRSRGHAGVLHVTQSHEGERIAYTLMMGDRWLLEGAISLEAAAPHQTRVLWISRWQGAALPWARYRDLMMMVWLGHDFSTGLENLRKLAETTAPVLEPVN